MIDKKVYTFSLGVLIFVLLDAGSKFLALKYAQAPLVFITDFLKLETTTNSGIAFGIQVPNIAVAGLTPIVLFFVWRMLKAHLHEKPVRFCAMLIFAGAIGNLIDRIFRGAVVDFISFSFWPSFNLADSYLTIAVFLLLLNYAKIK